MNKRTDLITLVSCTLLMSGCMAFPAMSTMRQPQAQQSPPEESGEPSNLRTAEEPRQHEATVERHESTRESREESHTVNGRDVKPATARGDAGPPVASDRDVSDVVRALKRMAMADRTAALRNLIDAYYLTVDHVGTLLDTMPKADHIRALDIVACSVVDPQHAGRITSVVSQSDAKEAVSILTQRCFTKFAHDSRAAGHVAQKAAPPPGAYKLPGEE